MSGGPTFPETSGLIGCAAQHSTKRKRLAGIVSTALESFEGSGGKQFQCERNYCIMVSFKGDGGRTPRWELQEY